MWVVWVEIGVDLPLTSLVVSDLSDFDDLHNKHIFREYNEEIIDGYIQNWHNESKQINFSDVFSQENIAMQIHSWMI